MLSAVKSCRAQGKDVMNHIGRLSILAAAAAVAGCGTVERGIMALDASAWKSSEWISAKDAPVAGAAEKRLRNAAPGTSWFVRELENERDVVSAKWMIASLGVFEAYVNGVRVGDDFLAPGFTHARKTKYAFTYDVTRLLRGGKGEANVFAAQVSSGWWRDKIVGYIGEKSAIRCVIELTFGDGTRRLYGTNVRDWKAGVGGPVVRAGIFDGEVFDARRPPMWACLDKLGEPVANTEFSGEILPTDGAEVTLRSDLALSPVEAYAWNGVDGDNGAEGGARAFGRVRVCRRFAAGEPMVIEPGQTLVVDFGQNAAAVPAFVFGAAEGTELTALPAEMLNDGNGEASRGNDGPAGSVYRANLRVPNSCMALKYTFSAAEGDVEYMPRFTFFGYRYISIAATGRVCIKRLVSVPVSSVSKSMETGRLETGVPDLNRLVANIYWGQLSNYLSVPTDCPQRNERLGWTADTQVFCEAGSFNADTRRFFHKWMRDMRDSQDARGGFPGVAPQAQYGNSPMRLGWADAGVIVPYQVWRQFGDVQIVDENWDAMERYMKRVDETKYAHGEIAEECGNYQWADWLSYERLESCGGGAHETGPDGKRRPKDDALAYWDYLGACYWLWDSQMMEAMARATGRDAAKYADMAARAKAHLKGRFFASEDGMVLPVLRGMQTPALFALKLGLVEGDAKAKTAAALRKHIDDHGGCLQTGFLGTSILMDTLTENGMADVAYTILLQRKNPSWLYSVDQGATTIWERWNSYTKERGFGPVSMNSFNHYAYGAVLAWMYRTMAGISADQSAPGFRRIVMKPVPDRRVGRVKAEYRSAAGMVTSAWRYEGDKWIWDFSVPEGATALVTVPGEAASKTYGPGAHHVER